MLQATFIGHQGWLLSTAQTHVLVDPLLTEGFGHGGLAGTVFPPRRFDFERMPEIDAVWLTHEHDDHVCFPSLSRLARTVPIYLSSRSSVALSGVLEDQGFTVRRVDAGATVRIGSLVVRTFAADHRATPNADEWDVLPFLATDAADELGFASSVDVAMPESLLNAIASLPLRRWMLCVANNTTDVRFVQDGIERLEPTDDTDALARVLSRRWRDATTKASEPAFTAITGGGWSHPEDVAWIDRVAFCIDPQRLAENMARACSARVSAVRPGDQVVLTPEGDSHGTAAWIESAAIRRRPAGPVDVPPLIAPATRSPLDAAGWAAIEAGLRDLARYLYARPLFAEAHSRTHNQPLAFVLHDDGGDRVYAWSPPSATFERSESSDFACQLRLWACDLHALFEGLIAPSALCYTGRVRCSNRDPDSLRISPQLLWMFAHPLHRPEVARRLYDALVEAE